MILISTRVIGQNLQVRVNEDQKFRPDTVIVIHCFCPITRVANSKSPNGVHECSNGVHLGYIFIIMGYIPGVHNFSSEIGGLFEKTAERKLETW
jgi:hypothetical protein